MKILYISAFLFFTGCQNACEIKDNIDVLKSERDYIIVQKEREQDRLNSVRHEIQSINNKQNTLDSSIAYLENLRSGNVRYIIRVKCKQSRFSLDLTAHAKDAMNAFEFELPVDAEFYKQVGIGTKIAEDFRAGSLILRGSFSDMEITVVGKRIER